MFDRLFKEQSIATIFIKRSTALMAMSLFSDRLHIFSSAVSKTGFLRDVPGKETQYLNTVTLR